MFGGGSEDAGAAATTVAFSSSSFAAKAASGSSGDFWAAEVAWQREELARAFAVSMSDPQTVASTFTSYTTYLVTSTLCPDGVRRRYSDFDWLRDLLVARYHGLGVPLMPEKRLVGNQGRAFIEERMQGLETFMLLVLANPYLRQDSTLRMFLTQKGTAEFETAKKAASGGVGADPASNSGLARWFGVLRALPLPVDADAACTELSAHVDDLEARAVTALAAVTRYWEASKATADSLRAMRDALNDWAASTGSSAGAMTATLAPLKSQSSVLADKLKKTSDVFSNAHDLSVFAPNEIQIFLLDGLVTETQRLRSLKSLLAVRATAQQEYSRSWVAQDKLHFQAKQFREKGREDKASQLEPKIAEAVGIMKALKERLDDITKGVLNVEADKTARARLQRFVAMAGQYAALCIASGLRSQELWSGFLTTMELDQNAMVADAQDTLTGKSSIHGLDALPGVAASLPVPTAALTGGVPNVKPAAASAPAFSLGAAPVAAASSSGDALFVGSSSPAAEAAAAPAAATGGDLFGKDTEF